MFQFETVNRNIINEASEDIEDVENISISSDEAEELLKAMRGKIETISNIVSKTTEINFFIIFSLIF